MQHLRETLREIATGDAGYAGIALPRAIADSAAERPWWQRQPLLALHALVIFCCVQSVLTGLATFGLIHTLSISVLVLSGARIALSLVVAHALHQAERALHSPDLAALVQAQTDELRAINAHLAAEIVAGRQSAAAMASEYAHLLEQARAMAATEERTRLARDLHDSVTQTLYSASLITQVLPAVWQRNPNEGARSLIMLRQLVRGALAEMRTLLFELRPAALEAANLGILLQQLGDVLTGHTRIPVTVTSEGEAEPPTVVKIAVYRIVQEAFNNIAKHAGATQVDVTLCLAPGEVSLHVGDNGRGFDPTRVPGERMGVRIMAERAAGIGAHFSIDSVVGEGTVVSVLWPALECSSTQVT